jgi:hypothetical protein
VGHNRDLNIAIGLQWTGPVTDGFRRSIESSLAAFAKTPLVWVIPAFPYLEKKPAVLDQLLTEIKTRILTLGDQVIPAGYAGAPHALLTAAEIARELEWSRKNPWGSGVIDVFKKKTDIILPPAADFSRKTARELYTAAGFRWIGVPVPEAAGAYRFAGPAQAGGIVPYHYFPVSRSAGLKPGRLIASFLPRDLDNLFLLARPGDPEELPLLLALIGELSKRRGVRFSFDDMFGTIGAAARTGPIAPTAAALEAADTPIARFLREKAARLRFKDSGRQHDLREILVLTAGGKEETEKVLKGLEPRTVPREGTAYTANMPGEILLPGNTFDAHFKAGRLSALRGNGDSFLPAPGSRAFITRAGKELPLVFDRIFSFEKNELRGLEAFVLFPGREREHFFTLRYAFAGDLPWLIVSGEMRRSIADGGDALEAAAPLEIPLAESTVGERLTIRSDYPDGDYSLTELSGDGGTVRLTGSVFSLPSRGRHLVFGFVTHKSSPIHLLSLRTVRNKNTWTVWLNPFGAYGQDPARAALSLGEVRTFYISIREEVPNRPPELPVSVMKTIPAHQLFRLE